MSSPNVLFLLVDCLRADYLSERAHRVRTPRLRALASGGVHATQMIAGSVTTTPCVASIFTGLYSPRHGIRSLSGYRLRPGLATLPGRMREAGYVTHAEMTGPLLREVGLDHDFDSYVYRHESAYLDTPEGGAVIERLRALRSPWFAFVHLWELHQPRHVRSGFDGRAFGRSAYDRALSSLDAALAPLCETVGPHGVTVIHGDHGEQFPAPTRIRQFYRWRKKLLGRPYPPWPSFPRREGHGFDVWERLIRVPFVLHAPEKVPPGRLDAVSRQVDIFPTLLDLLELPVPSGLDGVSFLPAVRAGVTMDLTAYIEACGATLPDPREWRRGLRTGTWKYIESDGGSLPPQLYDLTVDPRERRNLASDAPDVTRRLREQLHGMLASARAEAGAESHLDAADDAIVEAKLRDLGYLE